MRKFSAFVTIVFAVFLSPTLTWGVGFQLGETKEESNLDYYFTIHDHGTGRVTANLVISDTGSLKPLDSVNLVISSQDGTGYADLSVALVVREVDGKQYVRVHLLRELAERAQIQFRTSHLNGKKQARTWYFHAVPMSEYLEEVEENVEKRSSKQRDDRGSAVPRP
ncbi:hypothetical protein N8766_03195 [bacterium]|jgi:hypothetical protein|nr:hypothetical protein [Verrucomicrobiota bacterium]MDA7633091.1 hypothetical protein [bacterium]MDA7511037.1 hypothetical protein [Verrucomicrobiota bacterium]MDA7657216.1 hypothetical protein [Verrucomicrobiota bacterium]MDA7866329.1 hypothetical protein [Verrucomicrobiota bacterium]